MGEVSSMTSFKSILKNVPSLCLRGLKISEHLGKQLESLNISFGKEAEIDIINAFCDGNALTIIFGECKGSIIDYLSSFQK